MKNYDKALTLTRVLTSGIIMSIEKNDREIPGLEKAIRKNTRYKYVSLVNSFSAGIHSSLWGQNIVYGDSCNLHNPTQIEKKNLNWLNIKLNESHSCLESYFKIVCNAKDTEFFKKLSKFEKLPLVTLIDFSKLGYGPAAAVCSNDEAIWKKCERLKIFGAFDLKTMWTQSETEKKIVSGVQFNYRLSPLVAACIKIECLRR